MEDNLKNGRQPFSSQKWPPWISSLGLNDPPQSPHLPKMTPLNLHALQNDPPRSLHLAKMTPLSLLTFRKWPTSMSMPTKNDPPLSPGSLEMYSCHSKLEWKWLRKSCAKSLAKGSPEAGYRDALSTQKCPTHNLMPIRKVFLLPGGTGSFYLYGKSNFVGQKKIIYRENPK